MQSRPSLPCRDRVRLELLHHARSKAAGAGSVFLVVLLDGMRSDEAAAGKGQRPGENLGLAGRRQFEIPGVPPGQTSLPCCGPHKNGRRPDARLAWPSPTSTRKKTAPFGGRFTSGLAAASSATYTYTFGLGTDSRVYENNGSWACTRPPSPAGCSPASRPHRQAREDASSRASPVHQREAQDRKRPRLEQQGGTWPSDGREATLAALKLAEATLPC